MKYSKRYIAFTIFLAIAFCIKFSTFAEDYEAVEEFRGAKLDRTIWNPMIASSVNEGLLAVSIDNKEYTSENYRFYMDNNLSIMVPVTLLRDALNCSVHVYEKETLLVEKRDRTVSFSLGDNVAKADGEPVEIVSKLTERDGELYVSLNDLAEYLDYNYSWDSQENIATVQDASESASIIPTRYDLREKGRTTPVRNQGIYGTCWSFAALGAVESSLLPEEQAQYSVDHMTLCNGFNLTQYDGGDYTMGMAYLAAWKGPVYEADDPYGDEETNDTLTAVKHVQEIQVISGKDYEKIKEAVFKYGGVQTSIYNALRSSQSTSPYYNKENSAYCYIGTEKPNHDVVIVGWDDSYSRDNFSVDLEGDGAFICQNSWGEEFGEDGFFYVSYYDTNIGTHNVVYTKIDDVNNYENIYQSDLCGWVGQLGYNKDSIYGANVFTANGDEELVAASFYATGKDTQYELYVVRDFEDAESFSGMIPVASGKLSNAGYYTVDFNQSVELDAGERYAIVLHITTPGSVHPLAIEFAADEATENVILDDGESYISANGLKWSSADTVKPCNICIKGFSNNR